MEGSTKLIYEEITTGEVQALLLSRPVGLLSSDTLVRLPMYFLHF